MVVHLPDVDIAAAIPRPTTWAGGGLLLSQHRGGLHLRQCSARVFPAPSIWRLTLGVGWVAVLYPEGPRIADEVIGPTPQ